MCRAVQPEHARHVSKRVCSVSYTSHHIRPLNHRENHRFRDFRHPISPVQQCQTELPLDEIFFFCELVNRIERNRTTHSGTAAVVGVMEPEAPPTLLAAHAAHPMLLLPGCLPVCVHASRHAHCTHTPCSNWDSTPPTCISAVKRNFGESRTIAISVA